MAPVNYDTATTKVSELLHDPQLLAAKVEHALMRQKYFPLLWSVGNVKVRLFMTS